MNKKVKVQLISKDESLSYTVKCIYNSKDNIIKYVEDDELKTITTFDITNCILTRKNEKIKLRYHFVLNKITKGELEINQFNSKTYINIKTLELKKEDNKINIVFLVEKDKFLYNLEVI